MRPDTMILGKNRYYSLDSYKTKLNNNVLVVGTSGAGKTRGIVIPNLLMATGSYVVSDPKGNLYKKYGPYLRKCGYEVKKLDFTNPRDSCHYSFFNYIHAPQDIVKVAHMLIYQEKCESNKDPFWDQASQLLVQAVIALIMECSEDEENGERSFHNLMRLIGKADGGGDCSVSGSGLDSIFKIRKLDDPCSYAVSMYQKSHVAADRTWRSILVSINARLGLYDTPEVAMMTDYDDIDIASIGKKKTAVFVVVSDTDRSMDGLANIFFTQAMNELCTYADKHCEDSRLPVPVRFILDDFATNCKIVEFPRMIASIRSRGISAMLMIQAESQLRECYHYDDKTIIGNCDTYVYLGGNDIETAKAVAERCDVPVRKILNMPVGTNWIFRRGEEPINGENFDLDAFQREMEDEDRKVVGF